MMMLLLLVLLLLLLLHGQHRLMLVPVSMASVWYIAQVGV